MNLLELFVMFTGLVESLGEVISLEKMGEQGKLIVSIPFARELALGDSVAINGCCLTVAGLLSKGASFDVLGQTLRVTSLGELSVGKTVNLERALRLGDRLGGHMMQGHVDGKGEILSLESNGQDHILEVSLTPEVARLCVSKGSLAVDGISLTVAELKGNSAIFWITPHTFLHTNLCDSKVGDRVNLEADILAKHVDRLIGKYTA